jgi:hypothetical protein
MQRHLTPLLRSGDRGVEQVATRLEANQREVIITHTSIPYHTIIMSCPCHVIMTLVIVTSKCEEVWS